MRTVGSDFSGGFFEEVISTNRDNIRASAYAQCGSPNGLRCARDARRGTIVQKNVRRSVVMRPALYNWSHDISGRHTGRSSTSLNAKHRKRYAIDDVGGGRGWYFHENYYDEYPRS